MSMTQPPLNFNPDIRMPVSGRTPLARHCSASGAQVAAPLIRGKLAALLAFFAENPRATLQEFAAAHGWQNNAVCSTLDRAKYELGWLEETGEVKRVTWTNGRQTCQAYHRLTAAGRRAWLGHVESRVRALEASR